MAKKILISYNFQQNEVQNAVMHLVAGDPGSPVDGQVWYDSSGTVMKWKANGVIVNPLARSAHTGTQSGSTLVDGTVTLAKQADMATASVVYRKTAGTGVPEVQTLATLKTDLGLTGTNTGDVANTEVTTNKDAMGGYAGLTLFKLNLRNAANTITSWFTTAATVARTWTLPDKDGTVAMTSDITGVNSGTNTGDQTITLTGDVTGSGTGSFASTLATVNAAPQTDQLRKITVNGKGLVTASTAVVAADIPTLTSAKISDFDTQVRASTLNQMAAPTADLSMNTHKITNVVDGTGAQDVATFGQLQAVLNGRQFKDAVRAATTADITLSAPQTVDGVAVIAGDRVLVKNQTTGSQNGIYVVAAGAWTRSTDTDNTSADTEVKTGMTVVVSEGTVNADEIWTLITNGAITVGTTAMVFAQTGTSTAYSGGTGITITGAVIAVDTSVVRKYAATIGDGTSVSITATHGLGTKDITYSVRQVSDDAFVDCDVVATSTTQATFTFAVAPASSALRIVVHA